METKYEIINELNKSQLATYMIGYRQSVIDLLDELLGTYTMDEIDNFVDGKERKILFETQKLIHEKMKEKTANE